MNAHYLLTPTHLKNTTWVALRTPAVEGVVGGVVKRRGRYYTDPSTAMGKGPTGGPYTTRDAAVKAVLAHAEPKAKKALRKR